MRNRLLNARLTPPCTRCGKHALVRSAQKNLLERCARAVLLNPFRCEECDHRFFALTWKVSCLEWDGRILVMPDLDHPPGTESEGESEFYPFAVIAALLIVLAVAGAMWVAHHHAPASAILHQGHAKGNHPATTEA